MRHLKRRPTGAVLLFLLSWLALGHAQDSSQDPYRLDASALQTMHVTMVARQSNLKNLNASKQAGITRIDSIVSFEGSYKTGGYGPTGKFQHHWYYTMAGLPPDRNRTTTFRAPIIPVSLELLAPVGVVANYNGHPLYYDATQYVQPVVNSPIFQKARYSSSKRPTQFTDAVMRAEFHHGAKGRWHTLLTPVIAPNYVMKVPYGSYYYALNRDGSCCAFVLIDSNKFSSLFLPTGTADSSTPAGNAEISGEIATQDISIFLFPNTYLYVGNPKNCCILGFHTVDYQPGTTRNRNLPRGYVLNYSSWITPGTFSSGPEDISAVSHEIAETFNDPFVAGDGIHGITPWWLSPNGNCEDVLEDGDAIEGLPNATYPMTLNHYTYHPQNEALLPWFEFERHSNAIGHAYSYPNASTLTALSPVERPNCQ